MPTRYMPGIIDKLFGSAADGVVNAVGNVVDKFVLTGQEKFDAEQKESEQEWRFKQYELDNAQKELDRNLEYYKTDQVDRINAREYAKTELASNDKFVAHFRYWFSAGLSFIIIGIITAVIFIFINKNEVKIAPEILSLISFMLGILVNKWGTVVDFYFGSSQGSSMKDSVIQNQANQLSK